MLKSSGSRTSGQVLLRSFFGLAELLQDRRLESYYIPSMEWRSLRGYKKSYTFEVQVIVL